MLALGDFGGGIDGPGGDFGRRLLLAEFLEVDEGAAEAGEGIGEAGQFGEVGVVGPGAGEVVADGFGDFEGGELEAAFGDEETVFAADQGFEGFATGAQFIGPRLGVEPVLVAAGAPGPEVINREVFAVVAEFLEDDGVGEAVVEHFVDAFAEGPRETGDFAGAPAGMGRVWRSGFGTGSGFVDGVHDRGGGLKVGEKR